MDKQIIVFSGMPAAGKDTITKELCRDSRFVALKKHRSYNDETEKKDSYENISTEDFEAMINDGEFVQYHSRYGRKYGISGKALESILREGRIPIIHIGRIENFYAFKRKIDQLSVEYDMKCRIIHILLWEEIEVLEKRICKRESNPTEQESKIRAAREEFQDNKIMIDHNENPYSYIIKNSDLSKTCQAIVEIVENDNCSLGTGYDLFMKYVLKTNDLNEEGEKNTTNSNPIKCEKKIANYKIRNRQFSRSVEIKDIKAKDGSDALEFENCIFSNIKLSEINCSDIRFINCRIQGELRIYQGKIKRIIIRGCEHIGRIVLEDLNKNIQDEPDVKVTASDISELKVIDTNLSKIVFDDVYSNCGTITFIKRGGVDSINVSCHIGCIVIKELPSIVLTKEGKIDSIELECIDKRTLRKYEKSTRDNNGDKHLEDDFERYKSIVLATYESFERRKMFAESDICLFEIRRLGIIIQKCTRSFAKKMFYNLVKFFAEDCFGWGIKIMNNIVTMFVVVMGFAGLYSVISLKCDKGMNFEKCFEIALNRFFLIGADEFEQSFLPYLDSIESIIGVILLTVITGVLVRKIIR